MRRLAGCAALFAAASLGAATGCKSSPTTTHPADSGSPVEAGATDGGVDAAALSYDFSALDAEEFGGTWATDGLLVMVDGQIVHEKYGPSWSATMPHVLYSATKSIGSALVGIAIADGLMKTTDSICTYVPDPNDGGTSLCETTIGDLLQMGSGISWAEDYSSGGDPTTSNVFQMLYGEQSDMGGYVASLPRAAPAGTVFNYSSGDSDLLALAFKAALKGQDARAYAQSKLFEPAGITSEVFQADLSGTLVFSTYCFLTLRDFAKFGQLYLDNGMSGGTQVIPSSWITYSITPAPPVATPTSRVDDAGPGPGGSYGAGWWLNAATPTSTIDTWEYPHEPVDGFNAEGHFGQKLMVIPSRHMLVARVGADIGATTYVPDAMIGLAVAAVDNALDGGTQ